MKFIKSFYFNKNKKYQINEMFTNWLLSILIIILFIWTIFLGIVIRELNNWDSKLIFKSGKINGEFNTKPIAYLLILIISIFLLILLMIPITQNKLEKIANRKRVEFINKIKDILDKKPLKALSNDEVKKIFIALKLWNMFAKKKAIDSFTREKMEIRIRRELREFFYAKKFHEWKRKNLKNNK